MLWLVRVRSLQLLVLPGLLSGSLHAAELAVPAAADLQRERAEITARLAALPEAISSSQLHGRIGFYGQPKATQWIVIDLGVRVVPDEVVLFPARLPVDSGGDGSEGFPPEIEVEIASEASFAEAVRLGRWQEPLPGGTLSPVFLRFQLPPEMRAAGRFLRLRIFGSRPRASGRGSFFTLGEVMVLAEGRNVALQRPVETSGGIENAPRWQAENLTDGYLWCLPGQGFQEAEWNGFHSAIEREAAHRKWVEVRFSTEEPVDEVHLVPAHPRDFADTSGFGFPPRFRVLGFDAEDRETVLLDGCEPPFPSPGDATVMIPAGGRLLKRVRVECVELWQRTGDYLVALAELQAWSKGRNVAAGSPVTALDAVEIGIWRMQALTDGSSSRRALLPLTGWLEGLDERAVLQLRLAEIDRLLALKAVETRRIAVAVGVGLAVAVVGVLLGLLVWQRRRAAVSREELRERIAHDLHDELGASLSHLALESDLARRQLDQGDPVRERLTVLSETARETLDNMRDVIWLLAPTADSWRGFQRRIASITARMLEGVEHAFTVQGEPPPGRPEIGWAREWVLYFKEALSNARRHSKAARIEVELHWEARELELSVRDDGCGFDPDDPSLSAGLGMKTYRRRAAALHGSHSISRNVGQGTTVHLTVPLPGRKP
ncbi:MAG: histidine kinase [Prosthecobacter sp.]